jgi:CRISPR-associated protein Cmr2
MFKQWYKCHADGWQKHLQPEAKTSIEWPTWPFSTFDELIDIAKHVSQELQNSKEEGE